MNPYRCTFQLGIERSLEYRVNFFLSLVSCIFPILIQTFLWSYLYGHSDTSSITGYHYNEIMIYTFFAALVSKLVSTGFEYTINSDIKYGGLNKYLVRPIEYHYYQLFSFLGEKTPQVMLLLLITIGLLFIFVAWLDFTFSFLRIILFLFALYFGIILNFYIFYCIALLSFWLTDVNLLFGTVNVVLVVLGGGIFPMDIFGETITHLLSILPFGYTTQFPINIINGRYEWKQILMCFYYQIFWIVVFRLCSNLLWKNGLKRFNAVG